MCRNSDAGRPADSELGFNVDATACAMSNMHAVWFRQRLGDAGGRMRKVLVVALARKLLIALWRFATQGLVPQGASARTA